MEHWNSIGDLRISAVQLETRYQILPQRRVTPVFLIGMGYTWVRLRDEIREQLDPDDIEDSNGISASYGLGLHWALWRSFALQPEALLRTEGGGFNGGLRLLASWSPSSRQPRNGLSDTRLGVNVYWLAPLSGPWRFVEPGYAVRFERSLSDDLSSGLAFAVFHWQIPGDAFERAFLWDTRAVVAMPGVAWNALDGRPITLRAGPSIVMMGEGPGNGANIGTHIEAEVSSPWDMPISGGIGWFWMPNDGGGDPDIGTDDQHGLTVFAGLRF